jgi:ubiquinone/menaquinone biosynthesis C-methylase UbiE
VDIWKYHDITHRRHRFCNPIGNEKFEELCSQLSLRKGARVLDIACGKGEFLVRLAELYRVQGIGVDISPYCVRDCRERYNARVPTAKIEFLEMDAAKFEPESLESYDLTMCVGATFVYGAFSETTRALKKMTKPGGLVLVGEVFWQKEPDPEYLEMVDTKREKFSTHNENVAAGEKEGLNCLYTVVSNHDDWDHYENLNWWSVNDYLLSHPEDPDIAEILERTEKEKEIYLRWERDTLGWAIYVFRKTSPIQVR